MSCSSVMPGLAGVENINVILNGTQSVLADANESTMSDEQSNESGDESLEFACDQRGCLLSTQREKLLDR